MTPSHIGAGQQSMSSWISRHRNGIALDTALLIAAVLAAFTDGVVLWFHMIFVLLTISSLYLDFRTIAVRAAVWVLVATAIVANAVLEGSTQSAELAGLPLLTAILVIVLVVSHRRARALVDLERAQAQLEEHHRSERDELERRLEQAQKMDALGRLAGGIAHDFNNLLTAILGHAEDLADELRGEPASRYAEEIEASVRRASALIDDLMSFSRPDVLRSTALLDLNYVVGHLAGMLLPLIGEDIELVVQLSDARCCVEADRNRLEQLILNLAVNARDAMPQGGRLEMTTSTVVLAAPEPDLPPERYVRLSVSDTGCGIPPENLHRIFDPFFTTKGRGHGAGLGLSNVVDIVRRNGGTVQVTSVPGQGTTMHVLLPAADAEAVDTIEAPIDTPTATKGTETVLLVEDDNQVRERVGGLLRRNGYHVLEAADGPAALAQAREQPCPIDLLVTDVVLPGMSGPQLAAEIRSKRPATKVLFMSGYTDLAPLELSRFGGSARFLRKPFPRQELLARVRTTLDGTDSPETGSLTRTA